MEVRNSSNLVRASSNHQGNTLPGFAVGVPGCDDDRRTTNRNKYDGYDWSSADFTKYLQVDHNADTIKLRVSQAKRFSNILQTGDAQELLTLSEQSRLNAMKALSLLAKYLGCYDRWLEIKDRYHLKWSANNEDSRIFAEIYGGKESYSIMLQWVKETIKKLPDKYAIILLFDALTGLRADETCNALHIIHKDLANYYNAEYSTLEHFRYKDTFLRRTKKAYISVVSPTMLSIAKSTGDYGYNALRLAIKRRDMSMNMNLCRSLFATHLRMEGITSEIIDILKGRISKSVFVRHYMRPDMRKELEKVSKTADLLALQIINTS